VSGTLYRKTCGEINFFVILFFSIPNLLLVPSAYATSSKCSKRNV